MKLPVVQRSRTMAIVSALVLWPISASVVLSQQPQFPSERGMYLLQDDGKWRPVDRAPMPQVKMNGRAGAAFSFGISSIKALFIFKGESSPTKTATHPVFYARSLDTSARDFTIVSLQQNHGNREIEFARGNVAGSKVRYDPKRVFAVTLRQITDKCESLCYEISPEKDLPPGEFMLSVTEGAGYDFSVQPK